MSTQAQPKYERRSSYSLAHSSSCHRQNNERRRRVVPSSLRLMLHLAVLFVVQLPPTVATSTQRPISSSFNSRGGRCQSSASCCDLDLSSSCSSTLSILQGASIHSNNPTFIALQHIRGGAGAGESKKKKTKKKKHPSAKNDANEAKNERPVTTGSTNTRKRQVSSKPSTKAHVNSTATATSTTKGEKKQLNQALKETDAAQALGDAIRARADVLRDVRTSHNHVEQSLSSLSWSLGASDYAPITTLTPLESDDETVDAGGVEVAPSAVVASYFLKSHGGAHALQSLCSLLAATAGLGSIGLAGRIPSLSLTLLKRACTFALIKHVSGLMAASVLAAQSIPQVGFLQAREWMQQLALDPVSQYCFYSALMLLWLTAPIVASKTTNTPSSSWWERYPIVTLFVVGPIVLREVISTALVVSDVLVLLSCATSTDAATNTLATRLLHLSSSLVNATFSILVTPSLWRDATPAQRQVILAKLVQKCSLAMEVAVGALLLVDALRSAMGFLFAAHRPTMFSVLKRCVCANLYLQFLLTRRRKIQRLASQLRGGAKNVPLYVLDVLLGPAEAMGLKHRSDRKKEFKCKNSREEETLSADWLMSWSDYLWFALNPDEN